MQLHERIFELALSRSFFFPSNEPYGAVGGFYDYGPVGVLIKHKIENLWREAFIKSEGFHEMEASLVTPEPILVASGHVKSFADPAAQCTKCKTEVRADSFVQEKHYDLHGERWDGKLETLDRIIRERNLKCPRCGGEFGEVYMFNMMFRTTIGGERAPAYARPETAQGTYTAFPRIFKNHGQRLPISIGQVGRSFRNEISPRKGLVRMREFTQMELQNFFNPGSPPSYPLGDGKMRMKIDGKIVEMSPKELLEKGVVKNSMMAYFLSKQWEFYKRMGIKEGRMHLRVLPKEEVPHYSQGNIDMEVETSYGIIETIGNAYRTDFDLTQHSQHSGKDFSVFVEEEKKKVMPHVFEVAMGVDRPFFCILEHCFRDKDQKDESGAWKLGTGKDWEWFDLPPEIAPYHVSVFPLMKKDGLDEKARELAAALRKSALDVEYRESGSIGRRYARGDEIGVPYALTVDYDTLKDGTVTIRYRNDGKQERIRIDECAQKIWALVRSGKVTL